MGVDDFAILMGSPKPEFGGLVDSSAHQRSKMSRRQIDRMLKDKSDNRARERLAYNAVAKIWESSVLGSYLAGEFSIGEVFDTDAESMLTSRLDRSGFVTISRFRLRRMSDESRHEYYRLADSFARKNDSEMRKED